MAWGPNCTEKSKCNYPETMYQNIFHGDGNPYHVSVIQRYFLNDVLYAQFENFQQKRKIVLFFECKAPVVRIPVIGAEREISEQNSNSGLFSTPLPVSREGWAF